MTLTIHFDTPSDVDSLKFPGPLDQRLQELLDRQDRGVELSDNERQEAQALVDMAELLSLLRLRTSAE